MSRKSCAAAGLAALVVLAVPALSAGAQVGYGLAAGVSVPRGDFGKITDNGYHLTGLITVAPPLAPIGFRGEGTFSEFNYKSNIGLGSGKVRLLYGTANVVLAAPGIAAPYLIGGVGIYHASAECSGCTTTSTKIGYNGGAGFKFGLSHFSAFVEARYHYIPGASDPTNAGVKSSSTQWIPISFGVMF